MIHARIEALILFPTNLTDDSDFNTSSHILAERMRSAVVPFVCVLSNVAAFVPLAPAWRYGGAIHQKAFAITENRNGSGRSRLPVVSPLSMGFDFGKMMEKMTDPRYARVRHILIEEKGEEAQAQLEEIKSGIAGDVDKFSEIAEQISTCTSAVRQPSRPKERYIYAFEARETCVYSNRSSILVWVTSVVADHCIFRTCPRLKCSFSHAAAEMKPHLPCLHVGLSCDAQYLH